MRQVVLLAGGKSSRMGTDKLMLSQDGESVLQRACERFSAYFDKVYISVNSPERYPQIQAEHIVDEYPGCGPMAGIQAALKHCGGEDIFFAAADLPFSDPETALRIMELCSSDYDICITAGPDGREESLFGYYRACVLKTATELLQSGEYRIRSLFRRHNTLILTPDTAPGLWDSMSFANMNTPEEYRRLLGGELNH